MHPGPCTRRLAVRMNMNRSGRVAFVLSGLLFAGAAQNSWGLGPPIVCHPISIGDAKTLPDEGEKALRKGDALVSATVEILTREKSVLVRMETIRRAVRQASGDRALAWRLVTELAARTLVLDEHGQVSADALLDAGFLAAGLEQYGVKFDEPIGMSESIAGYGLVKRAIELNKTAPIEQSGAMQFAAALMTHPMRAHDRTPDAGRERYDRHMLEAVAAAAPGSLLETNLAAHLSEWRGSIKAYRERAAAESTARTGIADGAKR